MEALSQVIKLIYAFVLEKLCYFHFLTQFSEVIWEIFFANEINELF